ncbi:MAG TPA: amidohydrolase family protein [Vicinamibacterales bacterium]|jgi:Tol biopolymer transport system component|nr:amidohydrolase family protein [Vicinamibacterales bacterium]
MLNRGLARLAAVVLAIGAFTVFAQTPPEDEKKKDPPWDTTNARGTTREIEFTTSEGTWMSVDLSPDGRWIVFDLLAHVYRMPVEGGEAQCLTQDSGAALNFHPRISPDGKLIAFVSDRKGQNNLWVMNADGSDPRQVQNDRDARAFEPAWTRDGEFIAIRRQNLRPNVGPAGTGLWMFHRDGGEGVELTGREQAGATWPAFSHDGKSMYFSASDGQPAWSGRRDMLSGAFQIRRLERRTGEVADVTAGSNAQQNRGSSGGGIAPEPSPDGRYLAFARRIADGTISYKGHKFGPRTALWVRELATGRERLLMDPIEVDMGEGMKTWRVLPGYAWSRDAKSIVIAQGGKIRRVDVATGDVSTIPFTAHVKRTLSEMAYKPIDVPDGAFDVKFARWQTASPDGKRIAFQAVGRIWLMDAGTAGSSPSTPRRLTTDAFGKPAGFLTDRFEFAPAWSPDGKVIAFTTWNEKEHGHLWKVAVGATPAIPQQLTPVAGEFVNPVWSPDGSWLVVSRGAGETFRGRNLTHNPWFELVRVSANGGEPESITRVEGTSGRRQIVRAAFGPDGRIFYPEQQEERSSTPGQQPDRVTHLKSVRPDGSDKRTHLIFEYSDELVPSPDGKWVAFEEGDNVYVTPFPLEGTGTSPVKLEKRRGKLPVIQVSKEGGLFPRWRDTRTIEYGSGPRHFIYNLDSKKTDETQIKLSVPRRVPKGSIALTGARIVTLEKKQVIESGTIVVTHGRIACVGQCSTSGIERVVDVKGKTIIPGFIDMHAHHYREHAGILPSRSSETAIYLAYGVTTNLDNSMWSQNIFPAAELIDAGLMIGPRTYSTGDPLYRGDGPRQNEISSYEVAEQNIARLQSWGAVSIKQYLQPRRDQRQWISDIARKKGLMVTAEGDSVEYNLSMIVDGQTAFEHPMSYMPLYQDAATFFGQAKAVYSPTFIVGGSGAWNEEFFWQESDTWKDEKMRRWQPWRQLIPHARRHVTRPVTDYSYPLIAQGLADIIERGGFGAIGSHGQQHGIGSHWEVWMAASAMGPMGALELATVHGAHFLGASKDLGTLTQGKLGDLVVLNSNPLQNIRNTTDILYVMKGGILYDAATLDEIWPEKRPFGDYYWVEPDSLKTDDRPIDYHDKRKTTTSVRK